MNSVHVIAYLAPEIPGLSATFVYEELLAVERRGVTVVPFSVHRPAFQAVGQTALSKRTRVLYSISMLTLVRDVVVALFRFKRRLPRALVWLVVDMATVGLWRAQAWKLAYQWLQAGRLATLLEQAGCTHLHIHFAHVPTQIGMYAAAFTGIPFTIMAHANDIFDRGLLLPQKASRAAKMLTISQYNVQYLLTKGVPKHQLSVVRCGVSFNPIKTKSDMVSRERFRIGTLGRMVEKKGMDDLLHAMAHLQREGCEFELTIAGDGPLRTALEALVGELNLSPQVHFEGALEHTQVPSWLRSLDVFVLACKTDANGDMDGIPLVLMEAMSQCVAVVSTRLSGIPELIIHEKTGLLAQPGNPQSLADNLKLVLKSKELRYKLIEAATIHVDTEFGQDVNIDRLLKHFAIAEAT